MATEQPPEKVKLFIPKAMQRARNETCTMELNSEFFFQAIRMADVKAITDCRTLTLQAEDFVQLVLVV
jgi:hypothetical protein